MSDYDIAGAFERIENELIDSMMRNFSRHRAEETDEGYNWSMWQAEQLESLERYKKRNRKRFSREFSRLNDKITEMLRTARKDGNASQEAEILQRIANGFKTPRRRSSTSTGEFFKLNDRKLPALIKSTKSDFKKAEHAVLRLANDQYRSAIFNAQVYANTGAGTYEKAVDMACRDFLRAGLNCVEYKNGARHTLSDYASMAIRTASKRAYLMGEGEKRAEWGLSAVVVNQRQGGCPLCAPYIGRVFIDDVYSGGKKSDGRYPLLSAAISGGLFHPNCKDSTSTYYEGVTTLKKATKEDINASKRREVLEQQQSYYENQAKKCARISRYSLDEDNKREYHHRAQQNEKKAAVIGKRIDAGEKGVDVKYEYLQKATPVQGDISYDRNYDKEQHSVEIDFARWIYEYYGGDIRLLKEKNEDKVKTPDFIWNSKMWELKSTSTEKAADSAIRTGRKQISENPGGIFLDYGDNDISLELLNKYINKRMARYKDDTIDIIIVCKGKVIEILRYEK